MEQGAPTGAYREPELASLGWEGEMWAINLAVHEGGAHVADGSFLFTADEAACARRIEALASDAAELGRAVREELGIALSEGMEVEVSVERAQVGPSGVEDSSFEPVCFWHVEEGVPVPGAL